MSSRITCLSKSSLGLALVLLCLAVGGCRTTMTGAGPGSGGRVYHIVLCWLKEAGSVGQREQLIELSRTFKTIPGVLDVAAGTVLPSERAIVDSSFDVAIVLEFSSVKAMQDYLVHPGHVKAVTETLKPLTRKILVYDFVAE